MDAFEELASDIFWSEGYWVRTGVKVELTREEKIRIGRHSARGGRSIWSPIAPP